MTSLRWVQVVRADADKLWQACATPRGIARWQADAVSGSVRPGGHLRLEWPELGASVDLNVTRVEAPERLEVENVDGRVGYEIENGSVILTHYGLSEEDDLEGFASSWRTALAVLAHSVESVPGRDRNVRWDVRRVKTSPESVYLLFSEGAALSEWLGTAESVGPPGSPWVAQTELGELRGRVLSNVRGRDIALALTDGQVLVLRTLPSPVDPHERLVAVQRSYFGNVPTAHDIVWAQAIDRLESALGRVGVS